MFDWAFGRRKRDEALMQKMMAAAAEGHNKATLNSAMSTIVPEVKRGKDDLEFVAFSASGLAKAVWQKASGNLEDRDDEFVACLFGFAAANHFSYKLAVFFELASTVTMIHIIRDPERLTVVPGQVIETYNAMTARNDQALLAVGQNVAKWMDQPSSDNFGRLVALFRIFRTHIQ